MADDQRQHSLSNSYSNNDKTTAANSNEIATDRDRWSSRTAFILASIGSAIGLGNFWRFPYLLYKHGGGVFLIPYFLAVFVVGIPLLQLEITIGQIFQKGNAKALASLSPKMKGVGYAAAFSAFMIVSYYMMLVAWICVYFFMSFKSDLPWATNDVSPCIMEDSNSTVGSAEYYLYHDVLGSWINLGNGTCVQRGQDDASGFQWNVVAAMLASYVLVYLCVFRGAHQTSKVVYVTVTLPILIMLVLLVRAVTLDGASMGIEAYILNWDFGKLQSIDIWVDAVSQVLFSLCLSSSVMVSFGSYNDKSKPVLANTFIVALCNSGFSFMSGFVVWSTLGFYANSLGLTIAELPAESLQSLGLVFVTYPVALNELAGSKFWCAMLFLNLFMLGIDSAFSLVEGFFAVVQDTDAGQKVPRSVLLALCIAPCALMSMVYCQDTGLYWFDAVDHYVQYILLATGALQCIAVGWAKGTMDGELGTSASSSRSYSAAYVLGTVLFTLLTVSLASLFRTADELEDVNSKRISYELLIGTGMALGVAVAFVTLSINQRFHNQSIAQWWKAVSLAGPEMVTKHWMEMGNNHDNNTAQAYGVFWSIVIKYVIPLSLTILLGVGIRTGILYPYGNYIDRYHVLGWALCVLAVLMVVIPFVMESFRPTQEDYEVMKNVGLSNENNAAEAPYLPGSTPAAASAPIVSKNKATVL